MGKIHGVNLGNWLVLEKWMHPALFEGVAAEDAVYFGEIGGAFTLDRIGQAALAGGAVFPAFVRDGIAVIFQGQVA